MSRRRSRRSEEFVHQSPQERIADLEREIAHRNEMIMRYERASHHARKARERLCLVHIFMAGLSFAIFAVSGASVVAEILPGKGAFLLLASGLLFAMNMYLAIRVGEGF